jgi:hypothetical protein
MKMRSDQSGGPGGAYARTFLLTFAALLVAVAVFCIFIDPYGIFGAPRLPHLTAIKPAAAARLRLSKAFGVELAHPATLVIGSSVTNLGIDPEAASWAPDHRPVFNLGIDGATLDLQQKFLLHALCTTHPKRVVIVSAFEDSMPVWPAFGDTTALELRVGEDGRPNPNFALGHLKDLASATLSFRALFDSASTLARQSGAWLNYQTERGFEIHSPEEEYATLQGSGAAIAKMDREMAARILMWRREPTWSLEPLRVMIQAAQEAGADVAVVIPPVYADLLELRRQLGLSKNVQAWRAELMHIVDAAGPGHVALWDFDGLSPYTTDRPPEHGDMADSGRWFWDSAHFSPALGALMIQRIETGEGPTDLGARLDSANLAENAQTFAVAQRAWVKAHPDDVERVG